ncbi:MAG: BTAD domain-containing putative transcriptional regulator [Bacillota bacterium]
MSVNLQAQKYNEGFLPEVPGHGVIRRERLLLALRPVLEKRLTLVRAPAGSGKTVALSQFVRDLRCPAAWISLGPIHADAAAFTISLFDAISSRFPHVAQRRLGSRSSEHTFTAEGIASEFVMWAKRVVSVDTLVVLDDFHLVSPSQGVRRAMGILLEHSPRTLHFVISSRTTPRLELSRLRLLGEVYEVGQGDLAFSDDEVGELASALGVSLSPDLRNEIAGVTEGWAAGIVLLCYALKTHRARAVDIARLGSLGFKDAWSYMADQVLSNLDTETNRFLVATSVFDVMEPKLCDALVGTGDSERVLDELADSGMFTYRLPGSPPVYRYHHLLRDFLRDKLRRSGERDEYMLRAGELYLERGSYVEAVGYFLSVRRFDEAAACLLEVSRHMLKSGRHEWLSKWLAMIPGDVLARFPRLLVAMGNIREAQGKWDEADARYREAAALCKARGDREGLYQALWWSAGVAWRHGEHRQCIDLCNEALACLSDSQKHEQGGIHNLLAVAHFHLGLGDEGRRHLDLALRLQQEAGDPWGTGWVLNNLAYHVYMVQGDLEAALSTYERALRCFEEAESPPGTAHVKGNMAYTYVFKGDLDRALHLLSEAEEAARETHETRTLASIQILRAHLHLEKGDIEGARSSLGQAAPVVEELREPFLRGFLLSVRSRLYRRVGEIREGKMLAEAAADCVRCVGCDPSTLFVIIDQAAAFFDAGDLERARRVLVDVLALCVRLQARMTEAWTLLLLAAVEFAESSREWQVYLCQSIRKIASGGYWYLLRQATQAHEVLEAFVRSRVDLELIEVLRQGCHPSLYAKLFVEADVQATGDRRAMRVPAEKQRSADMEIRMLGGFQVIQSGQLISESQWKTNRAKTLFKYLAANARRWIPRDEILEALWPDKDAQDAVNNFNVTLHALRRLLEPALTRGVDSHFIESQSTCYRFSPSGGYILDVEEFESLCQQAQALDSSGRSTESIPVYRAAVDKYGGDFLPEDLWAEWTGARRETLKESFIHALLRLGALLLERNLLAEAAARARQAIKADPWREDAHRLLMTALARAGQRAKALQHYYSLEEAFWSEFGVGPDEETVKLFEKISQGDSV